MYNQQKSSFIIACEEGNEEVVKFLIDNDKVSPFEVDPGIAIAFKNDHKNVAELISSYEGHINTQYIQSQRQGMVPNYGPTNYTPQFNTNPFQMMPLPPMGGAYQYFPQQKNPATSKVNDFKSLEELKDDLKVIANAIEKKIINRIADINEDYETFEHSEEYKVRIKKEQLKIDVLHDVIDIFFPKEDKEETYPSDSLKSEYEKRKKEFLDNRSKNHDIGKCNHKDVDGNFTARHTSDYGTEVFCSICNKKFKDSANLEKESERLSSKNS